MIELISEFKGQLNAQFPRLKLLQEKKLEDPGKPQQQQPSLVAHLTNLEAFFEGDGTGVDAPDDISVVATDITTSASLFTRYTAQTKDTRGTRASSKKGRREERKKARGKKGTVYEEEYLLNSLGRLVARVEDTRGDVERLVRALMAGGKRVEAGECQRGFAGLVEEIRGVVGEIAGDLETVGEIPFKQISPFVGIEYV
jgi:elongator complex protein 1